MRRTRRFLPTLLLILVPLGLTACSDSAPAPSSTPDRITLDYAYYSPISLVLREFGWLEEAFADDGTEIRWVHSLGSNKANEYSQSGTADFASTAGIAALMARANGVPIRTVYVYSKPEWTALVAPAGSPIRTVADLKGKRVAATRGTDPYFFLLQALETAGLEESDVTVVPLQHPDGKVALQQGDVDAWAGLDPHMAQIELEDGARLFFREPGFNTYGFLNAHEDFLARYPEATRRVLATYERGRRWILEHPDEAAELLARTSGVSLPVALKELTERTDLSDPVPGEAHLALLKKLAPILQRQGIVAAGVDLDGAAEALLEPSYAAAVVRSTSEAVAARHE